MPARDLDVDDLRSRLTANVDRRWPGASVVAVDALVGGASSLTYSVGVVVPGGPHRQIIVKVAPPGMAPTGNRDVLRQAKLLRAIAAVAGLNVPRVLFTDVGDPPGVPPLFATNFVEGEPVEPLVDEVEGPLPVARWAARARTAAEMLARLHAVDPSVVGLDEAVVSLGSEVERWVKLFETVEDALRPRAIECGERLLDRVPVEESPSILHGDYRLGNMLCDRETIRAVIDWEIWSLGDPRLDLAWFLANTCGGQPTAVRSVPGLPGPDELISRYERELGSEVHDLEWFDALVRFKAGAAIALIVKHNRNRSSPQPRLEAMASYPAQFILQALAVLDRKAPPAWDPNRPRVPPRPSS